MKAIKRREYEERMKRVDPGLWMERKKLKAEKGRIWYERNRERIRIQQQKKYYNNREQMIEKSRAYAARNPAKIHRRRVELYNKTRAFACQKSSEWYHKNHKRALERDAKYREANRHQARKTSRAHSLLITDRYCREQLSKYSDKSMWEWTPKEVSTKREMIAAKRLVKITPEIVQAMRAIYNSDSTQTIYTLAKQFGATPTNVHGIIQNRFHIDPAYKRTRWGGNEEKADQILSLINAAATLAEYAKE